MALVKGLLLLGGLAGGVALLAAGSKRTPKAGEPGGTPASALPGAETTVPQMVRDIMQQALATGDPARIRATADVLEKQGYQAQAADLRGAALIIENEQKSQQAQAGLSMANAMMNAALATGDAARMKATAVELRKGGYTSQAAALEQAAAILTKTVSVPAISTPAKISVPTVIPQVTATPTIPTVVPEVVVTAPSPTTTATAAKRAAFAGKVALMLRSSSKGTEDQSMVQSYQSQEGLRKQDGKYGSETGLSLAETYDIVPPKPFYWGTASGGYKSYLADKKSYKQTLLARARQDPQRAEEWTAAAAV